MSTLVSVLIIAPPILLAVILHEIAHGVAAGALGDPTAKLAGRISLNPIKHIDPFMTLLLPGLLIASGSPFIFGGAKPVPVNAAYFANPRRGMCWVAVAGPFTNFLLAGLSYALLMLPWLTGESLPAVIIGQILFYSLQINLALGLFNLIPIPPLDGGRIAVGILPIKAARALAKVEPYGILIVMLVLYGIWS